MTQSNIPIPSWLETPPNSSIDPPVVSKKQELPFEELSWEDFEKLCLRLVRMESTVEYCQLYGVRGQDQEGIDIYARQKLQESIGSINVNVRKILVPQKSSRQSISF